MWLFSRSPLPIWTACPVALAPQPVLLTDRPLHLRPLATSLLYSAQLQRSNQLTVQSVPGGISLLLTFTLGWSASPYLVLSVLSLVLSGSLLLPTPTCLFLLPVSLACSFLPVLPYLSFLPVLPYLSSLPILSCLSLLPVLSFLSLLLICFLFSLTCTLPSFLPISLPLF